MRVFSMLIPLIYILQNVLRWNIFVAVLSEPNSDILTTATNAVFIQRSLKGKLLVVVDDVAYERDFEHSAEGTGGQHPG